MKAVITALVILTMSTAAFADQTSQTPANPHVGRAKMLWGAGLIIGGAFVMPVTSFGQRGTEDSAPLGVAMIGGGTALIVWGMRDRYKAANPQLTFGVTINRAKGVVVRRSW